MSGGCYRCRGDGCLFRGSLKTETNKSLFHDCTCFSNTSTSILLFRSVSFLPLKSLQSHQEDSGPLIFISRHYSFLFGDGSGRSDTCDSCSFFRFPVSFFSLVHPIFRHLMLEQANKHKQKVSEVSEADGLLVMHDSLCLTACTSCIRMQIRCSECHTSFCWTAFPRISSV